MPKTDITIIGAGHAGIEAAHIAAKMGASVLLVTGNPDLIGQMSCNPAIGGVAKGNIVREIDAMGGLMASLADRAGIQFRMLNAGKGSAVWGPRAQVDRVLYRDLARKEVENCPNVAILQAMASKIDVRGGKIASVILDNGEKIDTKAVIIAAGTFLNGLVRIGPSVLPGGRAGEPAAPGLAESIRGLGIASGRLKTCTPPRIDGRTVEYPRLAVQRGDADPWPFSFFTREKPRNRAVCWATKTNNITHQHILQGIDAAPGARENPQSAGPRYCPSIEDKIIRFGERDGHALYLEPESLGSRELYVNGLFTSLPCGVQERMVASIAGLENARIVRPGYEVEYDYFSPLQLRPTLESKAVGGLFFAGQVNGTSGYEEAACQGLMAGINAVLALRGEEPVVLGRDTSYIGVLIDDLVTKGTDEPYRMFTSRAEYRLILRQDNCDERLMSVAYRLGTVSADKYDERRRFWDRKREVVEWLSGVRVTPEQYAAVVEGGIINKNESAADLLRRPEVGFEGLVGVIGGDVGLIVDNSLISNAERPLLIDHSGTVDVGDCGQFVDNVGVSTDFKRQATGDGRPYSAAGLILGDFGRCGYETMSPVGATVPGRLPLTTNCGQGVDNIVNCVDSPVGATTGRLPLSTKTCEQNVDNIGTSPEINKTPRFDRHLALAVESDIKYEGFVKKQVKEIERVRRYEEAKIPDNFPYDDVPGLLSESRQKLKAIRPNTLGQASRIGGVTPADVSVLAIYICRGDHCLAAR